MSFPQSITQDIRVSLRSLFISAQMVDSAQTPISSNQITTIWPTEHAIYPEVTLTIINSPSKPLNIGVTRKINRASVGVDVWGADTTTFPNKGRQDVYSITMQIVSAINTNMYNHYSDFGFFWMMVMEPFRDLSGTTIIPNTYRNRLTCQVVYLEFI